MPLTFPNNIVGVALDGMRFFFSFLRCFFRFPPVTSSLRKLLSNNVRHMWVSCALHSLLRVFFLCISVSPCCRTKPGRHRPERFERLQALGNKPPPTSLRAQGVKKAGWWMREGRARDDVERSRDVRQETSALPPYISPSVPLVKPSLPLHSVQTHACVVSSTCIRLCLFWVCSRRWGTEEQHARVSQPTMKTTDRHKQVLWGDTHS